MTTGEVQTQTWFVTFGLGGPHGKQYSQIQIEVPEGTDEHIVDQSIRDAIVASYGTAWAFHYRPDQFDDAIGRYNLKMRELLKAEIPAWLR